MTKKVGSGAAMAAMFADAAMVTLKGGVKTRGQAALAKFYLDCARASLMPAKLTEDQKLAR